MSFAPRFRPGDLVRHREDGRRGEVAVADAEHAPWVLVWVDEQDTGQRWGSRVGHSIHADELEPDPQPGPQSAA